MNFHFLPCERARMIAMKDMTIIIILYRLQYYILSWKLHWNPTYSGPGERRREKPATRDSNPGCLTVAVI